MSTEEATRAIVFATPKRPSASRADSSFRVRADSLLAYVAEALGRSVEELLPPHGWSVASPEVLSGAARLCVDRAQLVSCADEHAARELYQLAIALQQLALEVQEEQLAGHDRRLAACGDGLARLRSVNSTHGLVDAVCQEIASRCEFGRVVLSRAEAGSWTPSHGYFDTSDRAWFDEWIETSVPLTGNTPEARLLTERLPVVVYDTATTEVHRDIIVESGQSSSYVIAPVMSGDTVVGFLHADHFPTTQRVAEVDRDLLGAFADGFSRLYERLSNLALLDAQRSRVEAVLGSVRDLAGDAGSTSWGPSRRAPANPELIAELTTREVEVLEMIVQGATNRAIGSRLVIAEDTVKSHVKQILRKLGVANRAQAIACVAGTSVM